MWSSAGRAGAAAVEEPRSQLAFLRTGELDDLLGLVRPSLDEGECLQDGVVHAGCELRPLLGPGASLALDHEVPRDSKPPRA